MLNTWVKKYYKQFPKFKKLHVFLSNPLGNNSVFISFQGTIKGCDWIESDWFRHLCSLNN